MQSWVEEKLETIRDAPLSKSAQDSQMKEKTDEPHLVIFANPSTRGTGFQLDLDGTSADPLYKESLSSEERK